MRYERKTIVRRPNAKYRFRLNDVRAASIRSMAAEPKTQVEMAEVLGVPRERIRAWMKELGLKPMSPTEGRRLALSKPRTKKKRPNRVLTIVGDRVISYSWIQGSP
jgi:hypothetical protein